MHNRTHRHSWSIDMITTVLGPTRWNIQTVEPFSVFYCVIFQIAVGGSDSAFCWRTLEQNGCSLSHRIEHSSCSHEAGFPARRRLSPHPPCASKCLPVEFCNEWQQRYTVVEEGVWNVDLFSFCKTPLSRGETSPATCSLISLESGFDL